MDIKFHCAEEASFRSKAQFVRAFVFSDYKIDAHNHDFYEMNIVLGGSGIHKIENSSFYVKKGDVFVIPPMTVHSYSDTEGLEIYHVLFKKDFIKKNLQEAERAEGFIQLTEIEPFLRQNYTEAMFLHLKPAELSVVLDDIKLLEEGGIFDNDGSIPLRRHTAWKILYYLSFLLAQQTSDGVSSENQKYSRLILDSLEYIHQHFAEKITIADLSERFYLSRSTFLRNFQTICGCSPSDYLKRYRVKRALEMLSSPGKSQTEIAHSCGFYDLSHMQRAIKMASKATL